MSRCGYSEGLDEWELIRWRGAVTSAIRGQRGQAFLKELVEALDALPEKKLVADELVTPSGEVCAIGSVMVKRGLTDQAVKLDTYDADGIAKVVGIAPALVKELESINDNWGSWHDISDERRFEIVREWAIANIKEAQDSNEPSP